MLRYCLALLIATLAYAAPADYGCADRAVRVAYHPFGMAYWRDAEGKPQGIDPDLVAVLSQATGCRFQVSELSRVLIWKMYEQGETDMVLSALPTEQRDRFGQFMPLPYWGNGNELVVLKSLGRPTSLADLDELPDFRLGIVRAYKYGDAIWEQLLIRQRERGELIEVADIESLYHQMKIGRINALISSPMLYRLMLPRYALDGKVHTLDWTPERNELRAGLYFSQSRFGAAELSRWEALLAGPMQQQFTAILRRYLGPRPN